MSRLVTLLTDFGAQDAFVGTMKGVLLSLAPDVTVVDLTHQVPPQDIRAGAFLLHTARRFFPPGTVHLAVVDPGVGGPRRPVAARIGDSCYVCPDNGLLSYVLAENTLTRAVTLDNPAYWRPSVSRTFHGRDIFAPAAAHLARGVSLETLGTPTDTLHTFPLSQPQVSGDALTCHVVYADVFGNVFTDLTEDAADAGDLSRCVVEAGGRHIAGLADSYSAVPEGEPLALFGSSGRLEVAVRNGSARRVLGLQVGDTVVVRRVGSAGGAE
jgi:S-adenosylmethionine hydrolase